VTTSAYKVLQFFYLRLDTQMPKSTPQKEKCRYDPTSYGNTSTSTSLFQTLRAEADTPLTGGKVEMRTQNEARIRNALERLVGDPPKDPATPAQHRGHRVMRPQLSLGKSNLWDAGRYYQIVSPVTKAFVALL
jgi:hypothetical protein